MTVRDLIQTLLLSAPDLDAKVYIQKHWGEENVKDYDVVMIDSWGSNDAIFIDIKDYQYGA